MIISNLQVFIKHWFLISKSIYHFPRHCPFVLCWLCPPVLHCDHEPPDWFGSQWHQSSDGDCQEGINNLPDQHDQRDDEPPHHLHIQALCAKVDKKYLWRVNLNIYVRHLMQFIHLGFYMWMKILRSWLFLSLTLLTTSLLNSWRSAFITTASG